MSTQRQGLTHLKPETFSSMKFTTLLPNTKLANTVNSPAIPEEGGGL